MAMHVTVNVPEEIAAQARARGISLEAYVQSLFEEASRRSLPKGQCRAPEQVELFFDAMAEGVEQTADVADG